MPSFSFTVLVDLGMDFLESCGVLLWSIGPHSFAVGISITGLAKEENYR
jgi:hypothetical protein